MNCVACHGAAGDGDGPRAYFIFPKPRNFLDPATQQILNRPRLFGGISDGVIGKEMPAWNKVLENQDIADIAEFVYLEFIQSGPD
jgi:mono/diheme cytochrome c family protein